MTTKTKSVRKQTFDANKNYLSTKKEIGYVDLKDANQKDYDRIGFMSGLEVHQQLNSKEKLFCRCPAGKFNKSDSYDAEIIRHMRPTLSELGEYDGTALMEFKTRKEIIYRISNETACTYEIDDTPPFKINREALNMALEISILSKLNIVGEVHITRKQYLDGSIPAGFQRTAILGVEGEIPLKHKIVRLIQLSIEEDSCREISDIGHTRIYKTDRLGMPLIETVTYPELMNPAEVKEAADYIRFLNRSTNKVRTGIGSTRADVNVSCKGGTRVEIKGVSHNRWMPKLTHIECFRQWALLNISSKLAKRINDFKKWNLKYVQINFEDFKVDYESIKIAKEAKQKLIAVNLPNFKEILSHFTQPEKIFADEISDRLKVIACLEKPNLLHSEQLKPVLKASQIEYLKNVLEADENDAQLIFWTDDNDLKTAIDTISERCIMAFTGVPNETRKSFENGTTIFERVLPGADRMYPDTDSAPIPLESELIDSLSKNLPIEVIDQMNQLKKWDIPEDTFQYILKKNLMPILYKIINELNINSRFVGTLIGHNLKHIQGHNKPSSDFNYEKIFDLFQFIKNECLEIEISKYMLPIVYRYPKMDFHSILNTIKFKKRSKTDLLAPIGFLKDKYKEIGRNKSQEAENSWVMGQIRRQAVGNLPLKELMTEIVELNK
ncbi:MAG: glutamyl-tRNA(Gln) amidotransferase subunit E [Bacteroidetes bacterium GWA2_31_9]|nr:MAG: glutamyl-tRNA(Gln) amidotransferase subunit E [Bacteroidetes bacterium GWA2_31_9]